MSYAAPRANLSLNDVKISFVLTQKLPEEYLRAYAEAHRPITPDYFSYLDVMSLSDDDAARKISGCEQRIISALTRSGHQFHVLTVLFLPMPILNISDALMM